MLRPGWYLSKPLQSVFELRHVCRAVDGSYSWFFPYISVRRERGKGMFVCLPHLKSRASTCLPARSSSSVQIGCDRANVRLSSRSSVALLVAIPFCCQSELLGMKAWVHASRLRLLNGLWIPKQTLLSMSFKRLTKCRRGEKENLSRALREKICVKH